MQEVWQECWTFGIQMDTIFGMSSMIPYISDRLAVQDADKVYASRIEQVLRQARRGAGLSLRELAVLAGTSHATLSAYEQGRKMPSAATFLRIIEASNFDLEFGLSPRIRYADGMARGDELAAVLVLAGEFPVSAAATLDLPIFPNSA
jgi:transcriptional regulator with XRE-family HTH domain